MTTNNMHDADDNNNETIERVKKIGQYTSNALLINLVAQCYTLFTARIPEYSDVTDTEFASIINQVLFSGDPVEYAIYDEVSESYWLVKIPEIEQIKIIRKMVDNSPMFPGGGSFPKYTINVRFLGNFERGGSAEDLYNVTDSNVLDLFQRGWDELSAPNLKPVGMLTPHDLCAYINFMETVDRLVWFMLYVLSSSGVQTGIMAPGYIITDRWTMMSMALFINMAAAEISRHIKQPTDMLPFKQYVTRAGINFHLCSFQTESVPPMITAYLQGMGFDMKDAKMIPVGVRPTLALALFTSVIVKMPNL